MAKKMPRVLVIGAHPDDCDLKAGGTAAKWVKAGGVVRFVAAANGQSGHHADPLSTALQRGAAGGGADGREGHRRGEPGAADPVRADGAHALQWMDVHPRHPRVQAGPDLDAP